MQRHDIQFPAKDEALREDVHELGGLVGEVLREQGGEKLFEVVEGDRTAAIRRREGHPEGALQLQVRTRDRPPALARDLARAFSTWFQVVNLAEKVHRIRRRRQYFVGASAPQPGGVEAAFVKLKEQGVSAEEARELLGHLCIEPVLTAHPTESTRRTTLRMQQRIAHLLLIRMDPTLTPQEQRGVWGRIREELTIGWQTEEHPRQRLTVADEREHVLFHLIEILYRIVPAFYEEIAGALEKVYGAAPGARIPTILDFGSWVGGDMDGNPDVHAKTIRETLARHHQLIVSTYFSEVQKLAARLSQSASRISTSPALLKRIEEYSTLLPAAQLSTPARHDRMPYRVFLGQVGERLRNTYDGKPNHYDTAAQFAGDIALLAESLAANKGHDAGLHGVHRLQRRLETFGFHLATLDVRQHTEVHHAVIAQGLGDAQWLQRPTAERAARLHHVLLKDQGPLAALDGVGKRTLWVFEAMQHCRHKYGREAIGHYIVSGASGVDDVLAVLVLARWAEMFDKHSGEVPLDIAPLFESVDSLERSGAVLRGLLDDESYRRHLAARANRQVVLLGYSDSNKESGLAAARWGTQCAQAELVQTLQGTGVRLTIFHGRGGTISRGGGRIDALVRSAPPGAVSGRLRVTEQGEVVNQSYGLRPIAMRSLERAFNALALKERSAEESQDERYVAAAALIARRARQAYRALVHEEPDFYGYFRESTPIDAIERMQIGSRPVSRGEREGLAHLRAIPWVFAWTQTRAMLPGWYGVGSGLEAAAAEFGLERLREMRARWFYFGALIDDVEAMLARADLEIASQYDALAQAPLRRLFEPVRQEFARTVELVLAIKEQERLLDGEATLQRAIRLRNPYVDPMHLMQIDLLKRWRRTGRRDSELFDALLATISGIAQGLQSTG
jgi:phosphoenolpyruvate carboxylase